MTSIYCVYKAIQKRNVVGLGQRSRLLVLTKRSAASGDENGLGMYNKGRIGKCKYQAKMQNYNDDDDGSNNDDNNGKSSVNRPIIIHSICNLGSSRQN